MPTARSAKPMKTASSNGRAPSPYGYPYWESAAVPGGGPTFSTGVQALMELDQAGVFKK